MRQSLYTELKAFIGDVLRAHPAFTALPGVIQNLPDAVSDEQAVDVLAAQSFQSLQWKGATHALRKSEAEHGKVNSLLCLLMWLRESRGIGVERIARLLHVSLWAPAATRHRSGSQVLKTLILARDRVALGAVRTLLDERVKSLNQELLAVRASEERALIRVSDLSAQVEKLEAALRSEQERAGTLVEELSRMRAESEIQQTHLRDEYQALRGRLLGRLRQEVSLLDEGLQALRRDLPKVHVMDDHAERVIHALKGEIERLRGEGE